MSTVLETKNGEARIRAEGDLEMTGAAELRGALLQALETGDRAVLDLACCPAIDLSCMQLIVAAGRALSARRRPLTIEDPLRTFSLLASECGFPAADLTLQYGPQAGDAHE